MISNWNTGAYGKVFLVRKKATGDLYAMKVIKKSDTLHKNQQKNIKIERDILFSVQNPFVVRLFFTFQNKDYLFWVMEYIQGGSTPLSLSLSLSLPLLFAFFPFPFPSSISSFPLPCSFPLLSSHSLPFPSFPFLPLPPSSPFLPPPPSSPFSCPFPSSIGSYLCLPLLFYISSTFASLLYHAFSFCFFNQINLLSHLFILPFLSLRHRFFPFLSPTFPFFPISLSSLFIRSIRA